MNKIKNEIKKGETMTNKEISRDGSFKRQRALFSRQFGTEEGALPVEKNRYRLIWAKPCPWSHRAVIVLKILGLLKMTAIFQLIKLICLQIQYPNSKNQKNGTKNKL